MIDSSRDASCALAAGGSKLAKNPGWLLTLDEIRDESPCPWTTSEVSGRLSDFAVWEESDIDIHEVGAYKYNICGILYTMPGAGRLAGTLYTLGGKSYATRGTVGILIPPAALSCSLSKEETLDRPCP